MKYEGVDTDHPQIVAAIQRMAREGRSESEIQRVVGMPREVVRKHVADGNLKGRGEGPKGEGDD
jgi:hypothetical protein